MRSRWILATVVAVAMAAGTGHASDAEPVARAEAAAQRAEAAATRTEVAAMRTEAAVARLERVLDALEAAMARRTPSARR